jgi:glycine/D-amino acid oxidase-like deaminating enzyme
MSNLLDEAEVTVIGGGIMGLSTAYHLAKLGSKVVLVEMDKIAAGASGSNAGSIRKGDLENPSASPIYEESYKMYEDWNANGELGLDFEFTVLPILRCFTEEHIESMKSGVWKKRRELWEEEGFCLVERGEWKIPEPNIAEDMKWGIESTNTMINIFRVCLGLARASERYGAKILTYTEVKDICVSEGRVRKVSTSRGDIRTEFVVNAAGSWASLIGRMVGINIPIVPRIGTALVTEPTPQITNHGRVYYDPIWFNPDKPFVAESEDPCERLGVTTEIDRHSKEDNYIIARSEHVVPLPPKGAKTLVEPETLKLIAKSAIRVVPKLGNIHIMRAYAAMRPVCEVDGNPILGKVNGVEGFLMAAGSWHTGMSYGPMCGKLISELVRSGETSIPIKDFSPMRFSKHTL